MGRGRHNNRCQVLDASNRKLDSAIAIRSNIVDSDPKVKLPLKWNADLLMKEDASVERPFIKSRREIFVSDSARSIEQFSVVAIQIGAKHQFGLAVAVTARGECDSAGIDGDGNVVASIRALPDVHRVWQSCLKPQSLLAVQQSARPEL